MEWQPYTESWKSAASFSNCCDEIKLILHWRSVKQLHPYIMLGSKNFKYNVQGNAYKMIKYKQNHAEKSESYFKTYLSSKNVTFTVLLNVWS